MQIGTDEWKTSWATVAGTASPATLTVGASMFINDTLITVGATNTVAGLAAVITAASITGVTAAAVSGKLQIFATSDATNDGSTGSGGIVSIEAGPTSGAALLTALGIEAKDYLAPTYFVGYSYQAPRWRTTDTSPRPTGSIWNNISSANNGMSLKVQKYSTTLGAWVSQVSGVYTSDRAANYDLDPSGGGKNIPVGTTYVLTQAVESASGFPQFNFEILERIALGATVVTGTTVPPSFTVGDSLLIRASVAGSATTVNQGTATVGGTGTVADFIAAISAANVPYVSASVNSAGNIVFSHSQGGSIALQEVSGTPILEAGFTDATPKCRLNKTDDTFLDLSNWVTADLFTYTASDTAPDEYDDNLQSELTTIMDTASKLDLSSINVTDSKLKKSIDTIKSVRTLEKLNNIWPKPIPAKK